MAADGGVVAEHFIFNNRLASAHSIVEVCLVIDRVAVAGRIRVGLAFRVYFPLQGRRFGMLFVPLLKILVTQGLSANRILNNLPARGECPRACR